MTVPPGTANPMPPCEDSAAQPSKTAYHLGLWRYQSLRLANAATPTGGVPFRQLPLSPLNSNCGSGNCNSRQICIYQTMGFKPEMFTVLFAIPRTAGWLAQCRRCLPTQSRRSHVRGKSTQDTMCASSCRWKSVLRLRPPNIKIRALVNLPAGPLQRPCGLDRRGGPPQKPASPTSASDSGNQDEGGVFLDDGL